MKDKLKEKRENLTILQHWFFSEDKYNAPPIVRTVIYEKIKELKNEIKTLEENLK